MRDARTCAPNTFGWPTCCAASPPSWRGWPHAWMPSSRWLCAMTDHQIRWNVRVLELDQKPAQLIGRVAVHHLDDRGVRGGPAGALAPLKGQRLVPQVGPGVVLTGGRDLGYNRGGFPSRTGVQIRPIPPRLNCRFGQIKRASIIGPRNFVSRIDTEAVLWPVDNGRIGNHDARSKRFATGTPVRALMVLANIRCGKTCRRSKR